MMLPLDVSSLFTTVPVVESIEYLGDFIRETHNQIFMTVEMLKELLTCCTQMYGFSVKASNVAMGLPLGPFLPNVFMGKIEEMKLKDTINDLKFYGQYVDDIFCLTNKITYIDGLVQ
ncbi:unnamed protein product [Dibothriocephalus latus]|uniref:Reverse transcriptase domain-containing protein n=1 Tax=Dibothriocephalus latus TaxID=60516 RepID=A0A3P7NLK9_DIBLA|nr:unnamed protein product [Dibothriocephalus latus]